MEKILEEQDELHARSRTFRRKVEETKIIIADVLKSVRRPYVAWSTGKDSTALLHFVLQQCPDVTVVFVDSGAEFTDTIELRDKLEKEWNLNLVIVQPEKDILELYRECSYFGKQGGGQSYYSKGDFIRLLILEPMKYAIEQLQLDAAFIGVRKEESYGRFCMLSHKGVVFRKDCVLQVYPLANWTAADVWAYIGVNKLPYNRVYDKTRFNDRNWIRVSSWAGTTCMERGRIAFLKYYYPSLYNRFVREFPEIGTYT